jgi:hypothetical protein
MNVLGVYLEFFITSLVLAAGVGFGLRLAGYGARKLGLETMDIDLDLAIDVNGERLGTRASRKAEAAADRLDPQSGADEESPFEFGHDADVEPSGTDVYEPAGQSEVDDAIPELNEDEDQDEGEDDTDGDPLGFTSQ